jgi:hypothetical protein
MALQSLVHEKDELLKRGGQVEPTGRAQARPMINSVLPAIAFVEIAYFVERPSP